MDRAVFLQGLADFGAAVALAYHAAEAVSYQYRAEGIHAGAGSWAGRTNHFAGACGRGSHKINNCALKIEGQWLTGQYRGTKPFMGHVAGGINEAIDQDIIAGTQLRDDLFS
jgi:hypothetical protein